MIRGTMFGGGPVLLLAAAAPVPGIAAPMKHTGGLR